MTKMNRLGKREREARKRHGRGSVSFYDHKAAGWVTLKLGRKKMMRHMRSWLANHGGRC